MSGAQIVYERLLAEAKRWKAKAIEERAILKGQFMNDIISEIHDDWIDVTETTKQVFRKEAARELEEEMRDER